MARARNIKPGFFRNADLAELPIEARLLFIGLWTIADREGRMEDRPKQIKMELFPADNLDCDVLLDQLAVIGVIERYSCGGKRYLHVVNFCKHQNPHKDEKASTIPDKCGNVAEIKQAPKKHRASTVQAPCKDEESTVAIGLIPDSLIPDSLNLIPDSVQKLAAQDAAPCDALPADDEPQRKTSGTPKRATQLPDGFEPDDTAASLAAELGVSLAAELPKFRDYHAARGKPMKDWQAAMRTWLRNAKQFAKPAAKQTESERRGAWLADITGRKGDAIDAPARLVG